jgi:hypothetical protein
MVASDCNEEVEWDTWTCHLRWAYNSAMHETTKETPHFLLFGRDPFYRQINDSKEEMSISDIKRALISKIVKATEQVMAVQPVDTLPAQFGVGDAVLLKTSFAQQSETSVSRKLRPCWSTVYVSLRKFRLLGSTWLTATQSSRTCIQTTWRTSSVAPVDPFSAGECSFNL